MAHPHALPRVRATALCTLAALVLCVGCAPEPDLGDTFAPARQVARESDAQIRAAPPDGGVDAAARDAAPALNTPDDLVVRADGTVYFTDPTFPHGTFRGVKLGPVPIYRITPGDGERRLVREGQAPGANGIELSPDEKRLYVSAYFAGAILEYEVLPSGALGTSRTLVDGLDDPDSLCIDVAGNLYVGVREGLAVLRPDGSLVTTLPMQSTSGQRGVTNCEFGGADGRTLYVTAWTSLFRVDAMPIPGLQWRVNQRLACPGKIAAPPAPEVPAAPLRAAQLGTPVRVADGFTLAEGPLWDPCRGVLLFADVDPSRIHQLTPPSAVTLWQEQTNYANGLAFDLEGRLLRAEMGGGRLGRITRIERDGGLTVLAP